MKIARALVSLLMAIATPLSAQQAARPSAAPVQLHPIRDNVYWASGGDGGNAGVVVGDKGVIVIDCKGSADSAKALQAEIAKVTTKPVTHIILTGSGGEGVRGTAGFADLPNVTVIAHKDTDAAMKANVAAKGKRMAPMLPTLLVTEPQKLMTLNGVRLVLLHLAPSHTSGESSVYLPDQRTVFTGYVVQSMPNYPIIHPDNNGSAVGWVKFVKALLHLDADTYVLGGGGEAWSRAQLQQRLDAQETVLKQIGEMVAAGKSKEEIRQALGTYKTAGAKGPQIYMFSEVAYDETVEGLNK